MYYMRNPVFRTEIHKKACGKSRNRHHRTVYPSEIVNRTGSFSSALRTNLGSSWKSLSYCHQMFNENISIQVVPDKLIDAVKIFWIIFRMVRCINSTGGFGYTRETGGGSDIWRNSRWLDVEKVATTILHHFIADAEAPTITCCIRMEQQSDSCRSRLKVIMI